MIIKNSKYGYLAKNTILFAVSSFGSRLLSFLLVPLYTSILSTSDYGTVDLVIATATMMVPIFTLNIADSVLRFAINKYENQVEILSYGMKVLYKGSILFALMLLCFWGLHLVSWEYYYFILLYSFYLITSLYQIISGYLKAIDDVMAVAISGIITTITTVTCNIFFLLFVKLGALGYIFASIIGTLTATIYEMNRIHITKKKLWKNKCDVKTQKDMRAYSIPLIFNEVAWWVNNNLDRYFVTVFCGTAQNGIYAVSYKIPTILTIISGIFTQAWNLSAIKEYNTDDKELFFSNMYEIYNAGLVIFSSGLILINIPIAKLLFAKDFSIAWEYSSILLLSVVFSGMSGFIGSLFSALKNNKTPAVATIITAIINTVLNILLIPKWGVSGAAISTTFSFAVGWLIRFIFIRRSIKLNINFTVNFIVYVLLVLQIVCEHTDNHMYVTQILIFAAVNFIYRKQIVRILSPLLTRLSNRP